MFDHILLPVDGSDASQSAQQYAQILANTTDAEIHALFVLEDGGFVQDVADASGSEQIESKLKETAESTLDTVSAACESGGVSVQTSTRSGHPTDAILGYIGTNNIDLVVLGAHARGRLSRFLRESIAEQVAQTAPIPVLTVRARKLDSAPEIRDILVAIDGSESARHARSCAFSLATTFDATVHTLYVIESRFGSSGTLRDFLERENESVFQEARIQATQTGVDLVPVTREGKPEREITEYANNRRMDLVVLGTNGRTGLDRLVMGSVATSVVRRADQPVLTVRGPLKE
ncbi:universal stress protein [Halococcus sp. IIIV-5B]|uniref:universal stress protein n=1 Tax=Halococcus sp. IIIV-5B TaxID=2321230 RepID=UPI000E72BAB6|nr:universal stress protein [Halococcus sp. IIIV-5B]RJT07193.1 universal stress protein [Halococcus sp. IIIV-5B]